MNRETQRLSSARQPADRERRRVEPTSSSASLDEEFNDFFDKGDIGDYEGGVAYSQPPPKHPAPALEDAPARLHLPQQRERRAFFARVVGAVVAGCVLLLLSAVRFMPHSGSVAAGSDQRALADQRTATPPEPAERASVTPVAAAVVAAVTTTPELKPTEAQPVAVAVAVPEPAVAMPAELGTNVPTPVARTQQEAVATVAPAPLAVDAKSEKAAAPHAQKARAAKTAAKRLAKSAPEAVLPAVKPPMATAAAPKQSVAAFPVE